MTGYYDIVLGLIPVSFIGGTGALTMLADLSVTSAVPIAAVLSVLLIGHALFVNGPVDDATPSTQSRSSSSSSPGSAPPHAD